MARYIDIESVFPNGTFVVNQDKPMESLINLINQICATPTADVVEVRHGTWLEDNTICSNCKELNPTLRLDMENEYVGLWLKRCPNCGALMDEGKNEKRS